jgi:hypothetical protein
MTQVSSSQYFKDNQDLNEGADFYHMGPSVSILIRQYFSDYNRLFEINCIK